MDSDNYDYSLVVLTEVDVDDPRVHVDLDKLTTYDRDHLLQWLKFRGDELKHIDTMKEIRTRVLQYFNNKTDSQLVDPTFDLRYKKSKVIKYGIGVPVVRKMGKLNVVPDLLENEMANPLSTSGWSKDLSNLPSFGLHHIEAYHEKVNKCFMDKATTIKKNFKRGEQLLVENFIDLDSVMVKENNELICFKFFVGASLKVKDRWIWVAITKTPIEVHFAYCPCEAGKVGTCGHSYAVMKQICRWALDKVNTIPSAIACTSKPCLWSVPQSRGRVDKRPLTEIVVRSPKLSKDSGDQEKKRKKPIKSTLYNACSSKQASNCDNKLDKLMTALRNENPAIPALTAFNANAPYVPTQFGSMPLGSVLSVHLPAVPQNFNVYCSWNLCPNVSLFSVYPSFPIVLNRNVLNPYLQMLSAEEQSFVFSLKVTNDQVRLIEENTQLQAKSPEWFKERKFRVTASINNKLALYKTDKGRRSLAVQMSTNEVKTVNTFLQRKMDFGCYHEPIAIQHYSKFMASKGHTVQVETSGLVVDVVNYIFGATPDGKVYDQSETNPYGILEVKCSEEYQNNDPRDIIFISKSSCLEIVDEKIKLKKDHSYYAQVQMQLAITTQSWCDFILFTKKGLVIDRVHYDADYWSKLQDNLVRFYFKMLLPELMKSN